MKKRLLVFMAGCTLLYSVADAANCGEQFMVASFQKNSEIPEKSPALTVSKFQDRSLTMTSQAAYQDGWLNIKLDVKASLVLKNPKVKLFIRFERPGNPTFHQLQHNQEFMTVTLNDQGMVSHEYDFKPVVEILAKSPFGFSAKVSLAIPKHVNWFRTVNPETDYALFACELSASNIYRPIYFFTNHEDRLGGNMSKILFKTADLKYFPAKRFDWMTRVAPAKQVFMEHCSELKKLGHDNVAKVLLNKWQMWNGRFENITLQDYHSERCFVLREVDVLEKEAKQKRVNALAQKGVAFYALSCWDDEKQADNFTLPTADEWSTRSIKLMLTANERDAFGVAVWSANDLKNLKLEMTAFEGDGVKISGAASLYHLKNWYQGGRSDVTQSKVVLQPELLLKDPDLVAVDHLAKRNRLKVYHNSAFFRQYPDDSPVLLPIRHARGVMQHQFWCILTFPVDTKPGVYRSSVKATADGKVIAEIPVAVEILPFHLEKSPLKNQLYTFSQWGRFGEDIARLELRNLKAHGIDNVGLFEYAKDLPNVIRIMREENFDTDNIYLNGDGGFCFWSDMNAAQIQAKVAPVVKELKSLGVKNIYFYLPDEAKGERLKKSVFIADEIRRHGGKTWGAAHQGWYDVAGKSFDHLNLSGPPATKEQVEQVHKDGNLIFCYNNPQGGVESPGAYRKNFGLLLWTANYDGGMTWAWWWPFGAERDAWNEFDSRLWKDHCMVYPTKNGLINTIEYEGLSKGINDTRYLATLIKKMQNAPESAPAKIAAQKFLTQLKHAPAGSPELLRKQMIALILQF